MRVFDPVAETERLSREHLLYDDPWDPEDNVEWAMRRIWWTVLFGVLLWLIHRYLRKSGMN